MKKIISFVLAAVLLVSAVPTALATNDYSQGTQVVYEATGSESYTITVPALLAPGGNGTVTLQGTWADNRIITVTAEPTVTLTNSIKAEDQKVLNVHFDGISEAGSNTTSQTFTETVSVETITDALFGIWSGKFNYNVEIKGNMIPESSEFGYWNTSGVLVDTTALKHTDYIEVEYGKTYRVSSTNPTPLVAVFNENYEFIDKISGTTQPGNYANLDRYITITDIGAKYISINYNTPDEKYIYMYEVDATEVPEYTGTIGFLGDSITKGFIRYDGAASGTYFNFGKLIARDLNTNYKSFGVEGTRIAGTEENSITNRASSMGTNLDAIVVMGGINDFAVGNALGTITDQTTDTFYGAMHVLLTTLTTNYADKTIVFLTPMDIKASANNATNSAGVTLDEYVAAIKEVCALYDITVIDTHAWAEQFDPFDTEWLCDGIHPTTEGHKKIASYVYSQLIA